MLKLKLRARNIDTSGRVKSAFKNGLEAGLDLIFPPLCITCRKPVASAHALCSECWSQLNFITSPFCERLGIPFGYDIGPGALSAEAIADPPPFKRSRSAVRYDDVARRVVHGLKFRDRQEMALFMSRLMVASAPDILQETDLIIPVPLHPRRLFKRRFNQSSEIAREIGRMKEIPVWHSALLRNKNTPQQVGLDRKGRAQNVQGAFRINPQFAPQLSSTRVLLIDDVYTTGATIKACTRTLLRAGVKEVNCLTFARVIDEAVELV